MTGEHQTIQTSPLAGAARNPCYVQATIKQVDDQLDDQVHQFQREHAPPSRLGVDDDSLWGTQKTVPLPALVQFWDSVREPEGCYSICIIPRKSVKLTKRNGITTKKDTINWVRPGLPGDRTLDRFPIEMNYM